jgi:hypothetical protein
MPRAVLPPPAVAAPAPPAEQRTVNITIGRLEIRAATPAPPRARPPAAGPAGPQPLHEFLRDKAPRRRVSPSES